MCEKSQLISTTHLEAMRYNSDFNEYTPSRIANALRRYAELKSAAEISATKYERIYSSTSFSSSKEDIICVIADIDYGINVLSLRQLAVVNLLKRGYLIEEIGNILGLSAITVRFHIRRATVRIATYLNTIHPREKGEKK